jgi:hypothetical protein
MSGNSSVLASFFRSACLASAGALKLKSSAATSLPVFQFLMPTLIYALASEIARPTYSKGGRSFDLRT